MPYQFENCHFLCVFFSGVIPIAVSWAIFRFADRYLPNHFFIYIFINAFFGSALAVLIALLALVAVLTANLGPVDITSAGIFPSDYLPFLPLIMLPEATLNGFIMTGLAALRPEWVATFDDDRYLRGK